MKLSIAFTIALALAGCSTQAPEVETRVVEIPSSKPYRFVQWSIADTDETKRAVRAHNRAHQAVIDAERKPRVVK